MGIRFESETGRFQFTDNGEEKPFEVQFINTDKKGMATMSMSKGGPLLVKSGDAEQPFSVQMGTAAALYRAISRGTNT